MHNLIHLCTDVLRFGSMENFTAFAFENHLGYIKKLLRKSNQPLQQVINRISEKNFADVSTFAANDHFPKLKKVHHNGPLMNMEGDQYKELHLREFCLKISLSDSFVMLNDRTICKVVNVISKSDGKVILVYCKYYRKENFFVYPIESAHMDIYKVSQLSKSFFNVSLKHMHCKCLVFPISDSFSVSIPLLHSISN